MPSTSTSASPEAATGAGCPGLFISFEGIDGAGKSTHIDTLAAAFQARGRVVTRTREPGGTPLAEKLRAMVLNDAMDPLTEALLIFAARRDHVLTVIQPALARGEVLLCDRFTDASFAYQGWGRGFDLAMLGTLERWVQTLPGAAKAPLLQPDLTLWFDLPPEIAAERLKGTRVPDRFEAQPATFFRLVSQGYRQRMEAEPGRITRIDGAASREQVGAQVLDGVRRKGWLG